MRAILLLLLIGTILAQIPNELTVTTIPDIDDDIIDINIPEDIYPTKDHITTNVQIINNVSWVVDSEATLTSTATKLELKIFLPNPCYTVDHTEKYINDVAYVYISFKAPDGFCIQKTEERRITLFLRPVKVIYIQGREERYQRPIFNPKLDNEAGVPAELSIENNKMIVKIKGCFKYEVEPYRCPNCYIVKLEEVGACNETIIELDYRTNTLPGFVKLVREKPEEKNLCYAIAEKVATYNEDLAKELLILCKEKSFLEVKRIVCKKLAERNLSLPICIENEHVMEHNTYEKKMRKLRLKMEELKRRLKLTSAGLVDEETGQLVTSSAEVEVPIGNKRVVVGTEAGRVYIKVDRVKVESELPISVDKTGEIKVENASLKVMPKDIIKRIKLKPKEVKILEIKGKPVYVVKGKKDGRFLFLFPVEYEVEIAVDVETGDVIEEKKPWWSFLVIG